MSDANEVLKHAVAVERENARRDSAWDTIVSVITGFFVADTVAPMRQATWGGFGKNLLAFIGGSYLGSMIYKGFKGMTGKEPKTPATDILNEVEVQVAPSHHAQEAKNKDDCHTCLISEKLWKDRTHKSDALHPER